MQGELDDIFLLNLVRQGDEAAFKRIFDANFTAAARYANFNLHDYEASEQIVLDIFAYIWEHRDSIELKLTFKAYIMAAARNRSINFLRDKARKENKLEEGRFEKIYEEYSLEAAELDRLISEAIGTLPDKCGEVFRLSRDENLSNKEIAERTGTTVKTVEAHITKALKAIRKYLGDSYSYLW